MIADDYKTEDISEIVPIGSGKTFTGEAGGGEEFDFETETNVKFVRTDASVNAVKMKLTINDLSSFRIYFVLSGNGIYYTNGGVYFWISEKGFNMGYAGKNVDVVALPDSVTAGTAFELELRTIPYYVNGLKAGYYAQAFINGTEITKGEYIATANCRFGNYFGFYMHNSTSAVTVKVEPVKQSDKTPVSLTVKTQMNKKQIDVDDSVKLESKIVGNYLGQNVVYEIVKGSEFGNIDKDGYLNGTKNGEVTIIAKVTNVFGTFSSEEMTIKIGNGNSSGESGNSSSGGNQGSDGKSKGCSGMVGGLSAASLTAVMGLAVVMLKKRKEK